MQAPTKAKIRWTPEEKQQFFDLALIMKQDNEKMPANAIAAQVMKMFPESRRKPFTPVDPVLTVEMNKYIKSQIARNVPKPDVTPPVPAAASNGDATHADEYAMPRKPIENLHPERDPSAPVITRPPRPETPRMETDEAVALESTGIQERAVATESTIERERAIAFEGTRQTEPLYEEQPTWIEMLAENLSSVLIETIVRTAESVAVRKAIRSLITSATDPHFKPEVDNTVLWESPTVGPRLPKVLVTGYRSNKWMNRLIAKYGKVLDLRFWRVDASLSQLSRDLEVADCVMIGGYSNHTVRQKVIATGKPVVTLNLAGGNSMMDRELQKVVDSYKAQKGLQ